MSDAVEEYRGTRVVIRFDGSKCIHSRHCVLDGPEVFVANTVGPWIRPDSASVAKVEALARNCPSGAITFERLDGGPDESAPAVNVARIRENGPLALHADLRVADDAPTFRATLCRCGASQRKPYCDGSHVTAGFRATGEPASQESQPLAARDGPLHVTPTLDGPLKLAGALEICAGTGRTITRVTETWLCRCGGSANKPFCDGTHRKIGFKSG
jgi:CDGSH-type Zn-finger protein/uncharacterized Fe-S cluster protein YjdI